MVHVDVDVEHSLVLLEQLQDREHAVVHVTKPRGFLSLGVVESAGPVYRQVHRAFVDQVGPEDGAWRQERLPFVYSSQKS